MGSGSWSGNVYRTAAVTRKAQGVDDFAYSRKVKSGQVAKVIHESLDPKKVAGPTSPFAGQLIRESRDSAEHPDSLPIAIVFDVTGSMGFIPEALQKKLGQLMDVVIERAGIPHPQILVGAVGDSYTDEFPFQIGQFESDNRFDDQLRSIILEGHGGGQTKESYGLAHYFAANHTYTDSFTKRGKKGYLFTMGDEAPYDKVTAEEIKRVFGVPAEADISMKDLVKRAQEQWEVFHLYSMDGQYRTNDNIHQQWRDLLGERVIFVQDSSMVCEIIAGIIHGLETAIGDLKTLVEDLNLDASSAKVVSGALAGLVSAGGNLPNADQTGTVSSI